MGDHLGSTVIAWRLIRDMMRLAFLMEQLLSPVYPKWLGSAFAQLQCAPTLLPLLERVGAASDWRERDGALATVYRQLAEMHNALEAHAFGPLRAYASGGTPLHNQPSCGTIAISPCGGKSTIRLSMR